jgi:HPr kinase/phosphorylase
MRQTSVARLYETYRERLQLSHVSGRLDARLAVAEERI